MAERDQRSNLPARITPGFSLAEYQDFGLTIHQRKQLETITSSYVKEWKLPGSYDNLKKAAPVVAACVKDGLEKEKPEPTDDLKKAFQTGYSKRKALIKDIQSATNGLQAGSHFEGEFAIPHKEANAWRFEKGKLPFLVDFPTGRFLLEKVNRRKPIFQQLVTSAREEIEKVVPGSSTVELTHGQEAGLVRNFIFSSVVYGEPRPLLEVGDYMLNGKRFVDEITTTDDALTPLIQTSQNSEAEHYIKDLALQIAEDMKHIPQAETGTSFDTIQAAYRSLQSKYLIENPFRKVADLSEDPDSENNIWHGKFATTVTLNDQVYKVPFPQTLMLLSYQKQTVEPIRASQLTNAAETVNHLFTDIERAKEQTSEIKIHEEIAAKLEEELQEFSIRIHHGIIDDEAANKSEHVDRLTKQQIRILDSELQLFPNLEKQLQHNRTLAWNLLEKYASGKKIEDEDKDTLIELYFSSTTIFLNMRYYVRKNFAERIRLTAEVFRNQFPMAYVHDTLDDETITNAIAGDISLRDIFEIQTQQWLRDVTQDQPQLSENELLILAQNILHEEKNKLGAKLKRLHYSFGKDKQDTRDVFTWIQDNKSQFTEDEGGILGRMKHLKAWREQLEKGLIPSDIPITNIYSTWRSNRDRTTKKAIQAWTSDIEFNGKKRRAQTDTKDEEGEEAFKTYNYVYEKIDEEGGPRQILLRTIARLGSDDVPELEKPHLPLLISLPNAYLYETFMPPGKETRDKYKEAASEMRKIVSDRFHTILESKGFTFDANFLRETITGTYIDSYIHNTRTLTTFLFVEQIVQKMLQGIQVRYETQKKSRKSYLKMHPEVFKKMKETRTKWEKSQANRIIADRNHRIESRLTQLKGMGIIRLADTVA